MNTPTPRSEDPELDAELARLPQWQPPQDFAKRLAAAAARQAAEPRSAVPPRGAWIRSGLRRFAVNVLASSALATALVLVPWATWATHPAFIWSIAGGSAIGGLLMTRRLLRQR